MNCRQIEEILNQAIANLFQNQPNFGVFTKKTKQTEWNIVPHLAFEIRALLRGKDMDIDLFKPDVKKRPDIVFHSRKSHEHNFLVIEVKRRKSEAKAELDKIRKNFFQKPYEYQFGAAVVIDEKGGEDHLVEVIENI